MDVHQATISVAVRDDAGKLVMESTVETKAATILDFNGIKPGVYSHDDAQSARRPTAGSERPGLGAAAVYLSEVLAKAKPIH
jgi:hypothetical protein